MLNNSKISILIESAKCRIFTDPVTNITNLPLGPMIANMRPGGARPDTLQRILLASTSTQTSLKTIPSSTPVPPPPPALAGRPLPRRLEMLPLWRSCCPLRLVLRPPVVVIDDEKAGPPLGRELEFISRGRSFLFSEFISPSLSLSPSFSSSQYQRFLSLSTFLAAETKCTRPRPASSLYSCSGADLGSS